MSGVEATVALGVAMLGAVPLTLGVILTWRTQKIVRGNGHGNVSMMVERIHDDVQEVLRWQGEHDAIHTRWSARLESLEYNT